MPLNKEVRAKVLSFDPMDWGLYCGMADLKILEGEHKGRIIRLPMVYRHKKGDKIIVYEQEENDEVL